MKCQIMSLLHIICRATIGLALIFFLAISTGTQAQSERLTFEQLNTVKGLANNNSMDIIRDSKGFVWIATEHGLSRYNGYEFTNYRNNPFEPHSIPNNFVNSIVEDTIGNIWVSGNQGLAKYCWEIDGFYTINQDTIDPNAVPLDALERVFVDSKQRVWALTIEGISIYNQKTGSFTHLKHDPTNPHSLPEGDPSNMIEDAQGQFWIVTLTGLAMYDEKTNRFTNFYHDPNNPRSISSNRLRSIYYDSQSRIWIGSWENGLNLYDANSNSFTRFSHNPADPGSLPHNQVEAIAEDASGVLWVGTNAGLSRFNESTQSFTTFSRKPEDAESLADNVVQKIYFDHTNTMWVCTRFGGVSMYDPGRRKFIHYKSNILDPNSLLGDNITSFAEDNQGNIWVGVDGGGLNYLNRKTNKFSHLQHDPRNPNSIRNNKVLALHYDSKGLLWIGYWGGGLSSYNPVKGTFSHYINIPGNPQSLSDNNIFYIVEDNQGDIWIATWIGGVSRYNRASSTFTQFLPEPNNPNGLPSTPCISLMVDSKGNIWVAHEGDGLSMYDMELGHFVRHPSGETPGSLASGATYVAYEDSKQRIWVGTAAGLNLLDRSTGTFTTWDTRHGLPSEVILGILEDQGENLWLSTNNGISQFNIATETFTNYDTGDGLQGQQFTRWAFHRLSTGELLFGGLNGFNLFNPTNIARNTFVPPVYITNFKLFNENVSIGPESILKKSIIVTEAITLNHKQNVISFEFTALNYQLAERNQYRYKLEGFNDDWINLRNERFVSFTNLDPGTYTLRVIASNNDGVWNDVGASLVITVIPPFWRTWWFYTILVICITLLVLLFIKQREATLRRDKIILEENLRKGQQEIDEKKAEIEHQKLEIIEREKTEAALKWQNAGLAKFSELINMYKDNQENLTRKLIYELVRYVGASMGGLYFISEENYKSEAHLSMVSYFAPDSAKIEQRTIMVGEGNIGTAFSEKTPIQIDNLPDGYAKLTSGLGQISLRHLLVVPALFDENAVGVFEILSLEKLENYKLEFIVKVGELLSASLLTTRSEARAQQLLIEMQRKAEIMAAHEEELRQNLEEMTATQEDMERQQLAHIKMKTDYETKLKKYKQEIARLKAELAQLSPDSQSKDMPT